MNPSTLNRRREDASDHDRIIALESENAVLKSAVFGTPGTQDVGMIGGIRELGNKIDRLGLRLAGLTGAIGVALGVLHFTGTH
jgi:hypothetical protein